MLGQTQAYNYEQEHMLNPAVALGYRIRKWKNCNDINLWKTTILLAGQHQPGGDERDAAQVVEARRLAQEGDRHDRVKTGTRCMNGPARLALTWPTPRFQNT